MRKFFLVYLLFICPLLAAANNENSVMVYRYWDFGASEKRDQYQFDLLHLLLEKTVSTYGTYELIKVEKKYTPLRASREISKGELMNIEATSHHPAFLIPTTSVRDAKISVPIPLLHGLLGYRKLIVRREDLEKFKALKNAEELKQLTAGQGKDWEDVYIYKYNNYKIYDSSEFNNPIPLLLAHRFDYLPLSIIEIDDVMQKYKQYDKDVAIVPNIIIYYPFPVLFNLSIHNPKLAERVQKGLELIQTDGSFEKIFEKYFADELDYLKNTDSNIFVLDNPNIPESLKLRTPMLIHKH